MHRHIIARHLLSLSIAVIGLATTAGAFADNQTNDFAYKYVATDSDVASLEGCAMKVAASKNRIIFGGTLQSRKNQPYHGPRWRACSDQNGKIEWAAHLPEDIDASDSRLETNGDDIWASVIAKTGAFQLAKLSSDGVIGEMRYSFTRE